MTLSQMVINYAFKIAATDILWIQAMIQRFKNKNIYLQIKQLYNDLKQKTFIQKWQFSDNVLNIYFTRSLGAL